MFKTVLEKITSAHIVFFGFDPSGANSANEWYRRLCIMTSDDGINFELVKYYSDLYLSDVDVLKKGNKWYVMGSEVFYETSDFETFESLDMPLTTSNLTGYDRVWAPQFCKNYVDDTWHIVYYARNSSTGEQGMYLADFDIETGSISNLFQDIDISTGSQIDPDICYLNGKYYVWTSDPHLYVSDSLKGPYSEISTNIGTKYAYPIWYEGPYMFSANGAVYLCQDKITGMMPGVDDSGYMVARTASSNDLSKWSDEILLNAPLNIRHGCFKVINRRFKSDEVSDTILN